MRVLSLAGTSTGRGVARSVADLLADHSLSDSTWQSKSSQVVSWLRLCKDDDLFTLPAEEGSSLAYIEFLSLEGRIGGRSIPTVHQHRLSIPRTTSSTLFDHHSSGWCFDESVPSKGRFFQSGLEISHRHAGINHQAHCSCLTLYDCLIEAKSIFNRYSSIFFNFNQSPRLLFNQKIFLVRVGTLCPFSSTQWTDSH